MNDSCVQSIHSVLVRSFSLGDARNDLSSCLHCFMLALDLDHRGTCGGTRRFDACSNEYASAIKRGSEHATPVKLTP